MIIYIKPDGIFIEDLGSLLIYSITIPLRSLYSLWTFFETISSLLLLAITRLFRIATKEFLYFFITSIISLPHLERESR